MAAPTAKHHQMTWMLVDMRSARHKTYDLPTVSQTVSQSLTLLRPDDGDKQRTFIYIPSPPSFVSFHSIDFHISHPIELWVPKLCSKLFPFQSCLYILCYKKRSKSKSVAAQINQHSNWNFPFVPWIAFEVAVKRINKITSAAHRHTHRSTI